MALVAGMVVVAALPALAYTSASYVQDGLVAQWDAIDNEGTGTHNPNATVWKDLAGHNDLTIVEGRGSEWRRGICFYMCTRTAGLAAAYGSEAATTYKTIEILFKKTSWGSRILFWGGSQTRYVVFDNKDTNPFHWVYFDGAKSTLYAKTKCYEPNAVVATYDDNNAVTQIYSDGAPKATSTVGNGWNPGDNRVTLGWRSVDTPGPNYGWDGEVYSIRLYNRALTAEEVARNHAIDVKRFFTSAMYDTSGLVSFWDAKDNVGEGQHSATTNIWKNLVAGEQDLTLNKSVWSGDALLCDGTGQSGAYGTAARAWKSVEVLFRNEKFDANAFLFSSGNSRYCVLATTRTQWYDYYGVYAGDFDRPISKTFGGLHSLTCATEYDVPTNGTAVYLDAEKMVYEKRANPARNADLDNWGSGEVVGVGGRSTGTQNFKGRIYAARLYNGALSKERVLQNNKIDKVRYANALRWAGGDGTFETLGNWRDVDAADALPGTDNTVDLPLGTYKITLGQDQTIGALRARNGRISHTPRIDATVDMGGHKLTVMGNVEAQGAYGYSSERFARLTLTNGTFQAEELKLGAYSDYLLDRTSTTIGYTGPDPASARPFLAGAGSLCVEGPGTTATIRKDITMLGAFTRLRVAGGAAFSCKGIRAYAEQDRMSSYPAGVYDRMQIEITGAGTTANINDLWIHRDVDFTVSDGAVVTIPASSESFSSVGCYISSIGRSFEDIGGNSTRMVVDNASLTLKSTGFGVGVSYKGSGGPGTSMTVRNGGTVTLSGVQRFFVGVARYANGLTINSTNCVLNVQGGSTFAAGSAKVEIGATGDSSNSGINVDDSTMSGCKVLYIGSKENGRCSSNDYFHVSGTAAHVGVTGTDADSIKLRAGAQLRFTLPANGFAATPITTAGGVTVVPDADESVQSYAVVPSKLVIDASAFDAERKGRKQTLLSCAADSTESLQRLVDNVEFVNAARHGTVTIEDGGTRLVYNGLSGRTMLIVR
ncbi:MAG: hypothetical protein J6V72_22345 [Kiritimatiellae bacterium]|nr:hypothetical protein [Kiritimatiellia bacterium]